MCACYYERYMWLLPMDICSCGLSLPDGEPLLILTYARARMDRRAREQASVYVCSCVGAHSSSGVSRRCRRTLQIFGNEPRPRMRPQCVVVITSINPMFSRGQLVPGIIARVVLSLSLSPTTATSRLVSDENGKPCVKRERVSETKNREDFLSDAGVENRGGRIGKR